MATTIEDIFAFIEHSQGISRLKIHPSSDLCFDLGIEGDDFFELEGEFEKKFEVDMSTYIWYFHHGEEVGDGLGGFIFKPPYERVVHIPVTPLVLLEAANRKSWEIEYPNHVLPPQRYDMYTNRAFGLLLLTLGLAILYAKLA